MVDLFETIRIIENINFMRSVEGTTVNCIENAYFPPVLSYNPTYSASFLTVEDIERAYKALCELYTSTDNPYILLNNCIFYNKQNFLWFALFFQELERLMSLRGPIKNVSIPYDKIPTKNHTKPSFYPPLYLTQIEGTNSYKIYYRKYKKADLEIVSRYKVEYIKKAYDANDFPDGIPAWYQRIENTVFEQYCSSINKRVKVTYRDGEFNYYVCGASDNWQVIYDVPVEMDYVVRALLFRE